MPGKKAKAPSKDEQIAALKDENQALKDQLAWYQRKVH